MGNMYTKNEGVFVPDHLIVNNDVPVIPKVVTLLRNQTLAKGTVLAKITKGAVSIVAGTNTGAGTLAAATKLAGVKIGVYTVTCNTKVGSGGIFTVVDPDGLRMKDATVGVAYDEQLAFTIADGTPDFEVGDSFAITVAAGSGFAVTVDKLAVDGRNVPVGILTDAAVSASGAELDVEMYVSGHFNRNALIVATDNTVADHEAALRDVGILLADAITY